MNKISTLISAFCILNLFSEYAHSEVLLPGVQHELTLSLISPLQANQKDVLLKQYFPGARINNVTDESLSLVIPKSYSSNFLAKQVELAKASSIFGNADEFKLGQNLPAYLKLNDLIQQVSNRIHGASPSKAISFLKKDENMSEEDYFKNLIQGVLKEISHNSTVKLQEGEALKDFEVAFDELAIQFVNDLRKEDVESFVKENFPGAEVIDFGGNTAVLKVAWDYQTQMLYEFLSENKDLKNHEVEKYTFKQIMPVIYEVAEKGSADKKSTQRIIDSTTRRLVTSNTLFRNMDYRGGQSHLADTSYARNLLPKNIQLKQLNNNMSMGTFPIAHMALSHAIYHQNEYESERKGSETGSQAYQPRQQGVQVIPEMIQPRFTRKSSVISTPNSVTRPTKATILNDTEFANGNQWHLRAIEDVDVDIQDAWDTRKGSGMRISIVDDGMQVEHPDLTLNTNPVGGDITTSDHWDFVQGDNDPYSTSDAHGTAAAGLAAARGGNGVGVAGTAYLANLYGLRLLGATTDSNEAAALGWSRSITASNNSWGPPDNGITVAGPGVLTSAALASGANNGIIYCWSAGNGKDDADYAGFDGYVNSIYTIGVAAIGDDSDSPSYSEEGSNILVAAPSNGGARGLVTTDLTGNDGYTTGDYTSDFGGTSGAAPIVSGIVALMKEARPALTWRDIQEILIETADKVDGNGATISSFTSNGTYSFSYEMGAGLINADDAVTRAGTWPLLSTTSYTSLQQSNNTVTNIPDNDSTGISKTFDFSTSTPLRVEHVEVTFNVTHTWRGDLRYELVSPNGMVSILGDTRGVDSNNNLTNWTFMSARHWGESSEGTWTVRIKDLVSLDTGTLDSVAIKLYGTIENGFGVTSSTINVSESAVTVDISVTRYGDMVGTAEVNYTTAPTASPVAATEGGDYVDATGVLNFADGETTKTIAVTLNPDDIIEEQIEAFKVTLSNPTDTGAPIETYQLVNSETIVTITDDDWAYLSFSPVSYTAYEEDGSVILTVTRTQSVARLALDTITVDYSVSLGSASSSDLVVSSGTVTLLPNAASANILITLIDDSLEEKAETFSVVLSNPTNNNGGAFIGASISGSTATVSILDNDGARVEVTAPGTVSESQGKIPFTITRHGSSQGVVVHYTTTSGSATSGSDYQPKSGRFLLAPGESTRTLEIPIVNDGVAEGNETFGFTISLPSNGRIGRGGQVTVIITD